MSRPPYGTPPQSAQVTGSDWLITAQEKASYDAQFGKVDKENHGFITGEQAVVFFTDSGLPEETLAAIWDLADINSTGQLSRDEFAVAMYLIRQQRKPGNVLPVTLPANLIPPSMRSQQSRTAPQIAAPQPFGSTPFAPTQAPVPAPAPVSRSATDDLFGLDAFSAPAPPQVQQSTGGSAPFSKPYDADPFGSKASSPTSPQFSGSRPAPPSTFKPFTPTSAFGQNLAGGSNRAAASSPLSQSQGPPVPQPSAMDDLLVDNDPEVNQKITQETTELANMSNQIGILRNQMQEVQNKKNTTEKDLVGTSTQKRDLELRLSQFRTQYEQEVKTVKQLEERLTASRNETRKLQQDLALIEGTYQDLQSDYQQKAAALDADQRENANLKERIRQVNNEVAQLKPQLEKLKSDMRQQKGLVAINKKQLSTNEGERDKVKGEIADLQKHTQEVSRSPYATVQEPSSSVASPAVSTASHSTNPFFRKSPPPGADNAMSPSGFSRQPKDTENFFGPSAFSAPSTAPPTSFRSESAGHGAPGSSVRSSEPDVPTPSTSPPLSYNESPRLGDAQTSEPRALASSLNTLRENTTRSESFGSSAKPSVPAGADTPTAGPSSPAPSGKHERQTSRGEGSSFGSALFNRTASPAISATSEGARGQKVEDAFHPFSSSAQRDVPGAFPSDGATSPLQPEPTGNSALSDQAKRSDPFSSRGPASSKVDFDAAFAGFGTARQVQERQNTGSSVNGSVGSANASKFNMEFPPIEQLVHDEDSDTNSEQGFADNFTPASPQRNSNQPAARAASGPSTDTSDATERPQPFHAESAASLPGISAQQSLPSYDQTVGPPKHGSNQFPPEFGGLLPSRQDPTSPPVGSQSPEPSFSSPSGGQGHALFGGPLNKSTLSSGPTPFDETPASTTASDAYHSATSQPSGTDKGPSPPNPAFQTNKPSFDDFDTGFDDLSEAKEADDKDNDEFMLSSQHRDALDEFNPVFDSPAASKSNTLASQQTPTQNASGQGEDSFSDFNHFGQKPAQPTSTSHDWDAIFSGMDSSQHAEKASESSNQKSAFPSFDDDDNEPSSQQQQHQSVPPHLSRALSASSEHDDPIVKELTGLGFPRSKVVPALETFDYDISKVSFRTKRKSSR